MSERVKLGTAATVGYFLGRTKKAKAAVGLALWFTGHGRPRDILRKQVVNLLASERGQQLLGQVRGPVLAAGRQATVAIVESQAGRVADLLERRAGKLEEPLADATDKATKRLPNGRRRKQKDETADEQREESGEQDEESQPSESAQGDEGEQDTEPSSEREPARTGSSRSSGNSRNSRPRVQRDATREPPIERRASRRTAER